MISLSHTAFSTSSPERTQEIAAELARQLVGGEFLALIGDLGAGKTTFTQGLVAAIGSNARVKSPTFTVMNEYAVLNHPTIRRVIHCDFYRFTKAEELGALELDEYRRPDTVIVAEWPDALPTVAWDPTYTVIIRHVDEHSREITIE
jgi:tRNA threonylcarbamoyladenosine biosynthesis protein TsaE